MSVIKIFRVDPRKNGGEIFDVEAASIGVAATTAAVAIFPTIAESIEGGSHQVRRETGDSDGSGMFRLYKMGVSMSDHGYSFHVMEI